MVEPKLQNSADDFNTWGIDTNMGVHYGKTHTFVVGSKHMTSANEGISVTINEHSIESVSAQKHLGITIDKNLTWEQQIDLVCRNVRRKLTLMKLLSKYVNQNSLKQYYNSNVQMWDLIVSVPDYCLSFYFPSVRFWICSLG